MKSLMNRNKTVLMLLLALMIGFAPALRAQIPDKPNPPRLVNDFAGIFTPQQVVELEDSLVRFSKRTSNQVTVVTVNDLGGMEASQFAYEIGEKWGVGGKQLDNGVVLLIKPKNDTKGQAFIATGYGVEGVLPDASCSKIINNEMIPAFKQNDYYGGTVAALNVILPVLAKEYSIAEYNKEDALDPIIGLVLVLVGMAIVFVIIYFIGKNNDDNNNGRNGNSGNFGGRDSDAGDLATAILLGTLLGSRSSGRSGGSYGGGSFGGGGFGGFGGFGGGSFGGGGAGGSW